MNKGLCLTGVLFYAIGLAALGEGDLGASAFMMVLGLGFIAVGLGEKYVAELFETLKSIVEEILGGLR